MKKTFLTITLALLFCSCADDQPTDLRATGAATSQVDSVEAASLIEDLDLETASLSLASSSPQVESFASGKVSYVYTRKYSNGSYTYMVVTPDTDTKTRLGKSRIILRAYAGERYKAAVKRYKWCSGTTFIQPNLAVNDQIIMSGKMTSSGYMPCVAKVSKKVSTGAITDNSGSLLKKASVAYFKKSFGTTSLIVLEDPANVAKFSAAMGCIPCEDETCSTTSGLTITANQSLASRGKTTLKGIDSYKNGIKIAFIAPTVADNHFAPTGYIDVVDSGKGVFNLDLEFSRGEKVSMRIHAAPWPTTLSTEKCGDIN